MRLPFQKKPLQTSCRLDNGVFSTPGTLALTKKSLSFQPSSKEDIDAGACNVEILLSNISRTSLGMHKQKLIINTDKAFWTFSGSAMASFQKQLKTLQPNMRATRVKDKRSSFRLNLAGKQEATVGIARLATNGLHAKVVDLSTTGCSILTSASLRVGDYLNVGVNLDDSAETTVFGRCVRLNRANTTQNIVSVQFISVHRATFKVLNDFILRQQRDAGSTIEAA